MYSCCHNHTPKCQPIPISSELRSPKFTGACIQYVLGYCLKVSAPTELGKKSFHVFKKNERKFMLLLQNSVKLVRHHRKASPNTQKGGTALLRVSLPEKNRKIQK